MYTHTLIYCTCKLTKHKVICFRVDFSNILVLFIFSLSPVLPSLLSHLRKSSSYFSYLPHHRDYVLISPRLYIGVLDALVKSLPSVCEHPLFPASFGEDAFLSPVHIFCIIFQIWDDCHYMSSYLGLQFYLIDLHVFFLAPCIGYCYIVCTIT